MGGPRVVLALLIALSCGLTTLGTSGVSAQEGGPEQAYRTNDRSIVSMNILPPGQGRYLNAAELLVAQAGGPQPANNSDQLGMYDSLVQGAPGVTPETLSNFFKDASFGVKEEDIVSRYEPRPGVVVLRDTFGVPHIYGTTRADVLYGAGYVTAEDRLFMIDTLRHVGRGRMSEFLGPSESNLASDRAIYATAGYTEEELQAMIDRLPMLNPTLGNQVIDDLDAYTEGINQFIGEAMTDPSLLPGEYPALQQVPEPWSPTDTVAIASLIGSQLGVGGGDELENAAFLQALIAEGYAPAVARRILADFRRADDPEAPVTTHRRFPWSMDLGPVNPKAVALPDQAAEVARAVAQRTSLPDHLDGPFGPIPLAFPDEMSNALLVGAKRSKTGRPIAVFGPQVGYWSPEILMEMDLHGPTIDSRGIGFPGISLYTLLGRGRGYAWSATSAGGDLVDIFAERLCNPDGGEVSLDSTFYMKDGECVEMMTRTDTWFAKPGAGGTPESPEAMQVSMTTQRTDNGIVQTRSTVGGAPVAWVLQRTSWGAEVDSALTYVEIMNPAKIRAPIDFQRAFARFSFTFNWFYVDGKSIAWQLGGYHPRRAEGVNPDLPAWGTGKWNWRGKLSFAETPKEINPRQGYIVSWNNKQAPGFRANDGQWSYGPVHRSQLLEGPMRARIAKGLKFNVIDLVNIMGDAATVDLRGRAVLPMMLRVIGRSKDTKVAEAVKLMQEWIRSGAHRRDKDADGAYDHSAAVALMDEWWEPASQAVFQPVLGDAAYGLTGSHHDAPGPVGSAFIGGLYGHMNKDLRMILGMPVKGRFSRIYCGSGKLAACRSALTSSLTAAISALEERFGGGPTTWDFDETVDRIVFAPVGVQGQDSMQWQNRPTFQQVVEFRP
ncbi:MAG TPA: penicillin acylase family protein [Actinomycetota bacterium]|nr:penicillin acylase family protein [Actinomycetota bacterium]